jgi:iron complex transport system permease protein
VSTPFPHIGQAARADRRLHLLLGLAIVASLFAATLLGSTTLAPQRIIAALAGKGPPGDLIVVWQIRLPRALAALVVGFALGISGAALQGLLRNPLAEPGVLGVSASASLGATCVLYYGLAAGAALLVPLGAVTGALLATLFLATTAVRLGSVVTLILVGVGLNSFIGALMALLMNLAPNPFTLADMVNWTLGSVANRSLADLRLTVPFVLVGTVMLWSGRRALSALALGEEAAGALGVDLRRTRLLVVVGAGLATGGAVALAGAVGFIGIVAPHLVRALVQYDPARTLLPAGLLGGLTLVLADIGVRLLPTTNELKLGVVAAILGAPIFVWIAMQRRLGAGTA